MNSPHITLPTTDFLRPQPFPAILPQGVTGIGARFGQGEFSEQLFHSHEIYFPEDIRRSVTKRQSEFLAGRILAGHNLALMGVRGFDIVNDEMRCPQWPKGVVGSISHADAVACCITAPDTLFQGVGVDVENIMAVKTVEEIRISIVNQQESLLMRQFSALADNVLFTAVFSAKEAIYKALYPSVRRFFDFSAVNLTGIEADRELLQFEVTESLAAGYGVGTKIAVHFRVQASLLYSWCLLQAA
ncbi:4'-phosphopantetheinyl transferase family protein [Planctobacterium marinum]|uniref:4'-phosphopantetheinyl transferase family protein n=1 Tax=Planctobacterium marinum TaxID=1631968 RepID=UPI001E4F6446|nr:4'-phosphopantetheinyl transferase superfamily protein [Planctobacterium marinum]MCC2605701.1 4'-phosphopantetheinyl transferase superfamily protein [Planctobacterium marinum]